MATIKAATVPAYLAKLPADRRAALSAVRDTINANLPDGYVEGMLYNMPCWYVPLARYPDTYNGQPIGIAGFASQKNYMALYLMTVYTDPSLETWFRDAFAAAGKKLDMGKSCVRFRTLDALPLEVIGETITKVSVEDLIAQYETAHAVTKSKKKPNTREVRETRRPAKTTSRPKTAATSKTKSRSASKPRSRAKKR